jgi:hypothetical protein
MSRGRRCPCDFGCGLLQRLPEIQQPLLAICVAFTICKGRLSGSSARFIDGNIWREADPPLCTLFRAGALSLFEAALHHPARGRRSDPRTQRWRMPAQRTRHTDLNGDCSAAKIATETTLLPPIAPRHSHSIIPSPGNTLISIDKCFPHFLKNRIPGPSEIAFLNSKGEFRRFGIRSLSATIDINRSIFLSWPPTEPYRQFPKRPSRGYLPRESVARLTSD